MSRNKIFYKIKTKADTNQYGFTLIELLVVIAIIGLLASFILLGLSQARSKGRDTVRKGNLRQLQKALELYYNDHGSYPCTGLGIGCPGANWWSSEAGDKSTVISAPGAYIPGLVPTYLQSLPSDPLGGLSTNPVCASAGGWKRAYLYISDGVDYKLLSNCAPENDWTSTDAFYESTRPTTAWQVSTPGAAAHVTW